MRIELVDEEEEPFVGGRFLRTPQALTAFFTITLPMIWEVIIISMVFLVISGLNAFEMIWLLTSQDPASSTHTLGTLMVTAMFKEFQIGRAAAIAVAAQKGLLPR